MCRNLKKNPQCGSDFSIKHIHLPCHTKCSRKTVNWLSCCFYHLPARSPLVNIRWIGNWFIIKAITMPIVVSKIRAAPNDKGLSSFPCVTVMHRKTTHMRNVPFSRFIKTEKLMIGIRSTDKNRYRIASYGIHQIFLSNSRTSIPHIPPITVAISLLNASRKLSLEVRWTHSTAAMAA